MATRQGRVYFCRPCDTRHESPTNAKCTRRQEPPGEQSPDDDPPPQETRARARPSRPKRSRAKSPPTYESVEGSTSKKQRGSDNIDYDNNDPSVNPVDPAFQAIMRRLDDIARESRDARKMLADESRRERDQIRASIAALNSTAGPHILSDEEDLQADARPSTSVRRPADGLTPEILSTAPNPVQRLRKDTRTAKVADCWLQDGGTSEDSSNKKTKSGFHLTINDNASVQAQWPQLNVYRSSNEAATYSSLTINEFCSGFMSYAEDCLLLPVPNIKHALDYITYLRDLMDEIPLTGWEGVRDAHAEVLRSIEQNRLIWLDIPNRTKHLTKALRRAQHPALAPITPQPKSFKPTQNLSNDKRPCPEFQTLSCTHPATHTEDGLTWLHNCATCLRVKGQKVLTPEGGM